MSEGTAEAVSFAALLEAAEVETKGVREKLHNAVSRQILLGSEFTVRFGSITSVLGMNAGDCHTSIARVNIFILK